MATATIATIATIASAVVGIGTGIYSFVQGRQAAKKQREAARKQAEIQRIQERRRRRQEIRRQRIARAQLLNVGTQLGVGDSSGVAGGLGSLSSQLGASQGYASTVAGLSQEITALTASAANNISMANTVSGFGNVLSAGLGAVGKYFSSPSGGGLPSTYQPKPVTAGLTYGPSDTFTSSLKG